MAVTLGKRKRRAEAPIQQKKAAVEQESEEEDLQDIFRRAFEAKFKPLAVASKKEEQSLIEDVLQDEEDDEESDWSGISEPENNVQIVEHTSFQRPDNTFDKQELRAFMSSKPPSSNPEPLSTAKRKAAPAVEEGTTEAANLKNDLALQRLLNESHLIQPSGSESTLSGPSGRNRHKATDLRLQALGSKSSSLEQKNMPLAHRKGIQNKAQEREGTRRKEARENGIILERTVSKAPAGKDGPVKKRERSVGGPSVGRFKNGTLVLSKQDVADIQGPKSGRGGRGGKSRGGGRGGRGGRGRGGKR